MELRGAAAVADRLCDFFVAVTHTILYTRGVYPSSLFTPRAKYGVQAYYCRHPAVQDYISETVASAHAWIAAGAVERVVLAVFRADDDAVVARYVWDVRVVARAEVPDGASMAALDAQLRAHLARVSGGPAGADAELSWDFVLWTTGVATGTGWMVADGRERREVAGGVVVDPVKDRDEFAVTAGLCAWIEMPEGGA